MTWAVEFYRDAEGSCPVADFIERLPTKDAAKIIRMFELLEQFGLQLGQPHVTKLEGQSGLWELRVKRASNIFRFFYVAWTGQMFLVLHGFRKKEPRTDRRQIAKAVTRLAEYQERVRVSERNR